MFEKINLFFFFEIHMRKDRETKAKRSEGYQIKVKYENPDNGLHDEFYLKISRNNIVNWMPSNAWYMSGTDSTNFVLNYVFTCVLKILCIECLRVEGAGGGEF
jgi:hypothetical protein